MKAITHNFSTEARKHLVEPNPELYACDGDPADRLIGSIIGRGGSGYRKARVVLLGSPQDQGVRRNGGRAGARQAPEEIRRWLFRYPAPANLADNDLCDLGDMEVGSSLEEIHRAQKEVVRRVIKDDKQIIVLGGGNDISYPDVAALAEAVPNPTVVNVDSHFDVRSDEIRHSGTPYRQLLEENRMDPHRFHILGCKQEVNSPEYTAYLGEIGANVTWLKELREKGIKTAVEEIFDSGGDGALFWGLDLDVVRSADAPGVSMTYPVGLTAEEICLIAALAGRGRRSRVLEISEVNPAHDLDHRTARLAAQIVVNFLREIGSPA